MPLWATTLMVFILGLALFVLLSQNTVTNDEKIGQRAVDFINKTFFEGRDEVELVSVSEESGVYKITVRFSGQEIDSFVTKDEKYFFPDSFVMIEGQPEKEVMSLEEINQWVSDYIKRELPGGDESEMEIISVSEESGVYKLTVNMGGEFEIYTTMDGKHLFPQGLDMTKEPEEREEIVLPSNIEEFVSCLKEQGFVFYGSQTCGFCHDLVEKFGGYNLVDPIYVECSVETERCKEETQTDGVPEIQIKGELYQGERSLNGFSQATGCEINY